MHLERFPEILPENHADYQDRRRPSSRSRLRHTAVEFPASSTGTQRPRVAATHQEPVRRPASDHGYRETAQACPRGDISCPRRARLQVASWERLLQILFALRDTSDNRTAYTV